MSSGRTRRTRTCSPPRIVSCNWLEPESFWSGISATAALAARHGEGERARQPAVDRNRLAVHVGTFIARQERGDGSNLLRMTVARERIELTDLLVRAALAGAVEDHLRHAGLDQPGTDGVDPHAGAVERIRRRLDQTDHARLTRAVGVAAGVGAQARDRRRTDDRTRALLHHVRGRMLDG